MRRFFPVSDRTNRMIVLVLLALIIGAGPAMAEAPPPSAMPWDASTPL